MDQIRGFRFPESFRVRCLVQKARRLNLRLSLLSAEASCWLWDQRPLLRSRSLPSSRLLAVAACGRPLLEEGLLEIRLKQILREYAGRFQSFSALPEQDDQFQSASFFERS